MKVLVACEESQRVCAAFRKRGHEAYSCDIMEPSGGHPEWHILGDVIPVLDGGVIETMDGANHEIGRWDLIIAHPPCTFLAVSGSKWFDVTKYGNAARERHKKRNQAICFFLTLALAPCDRVAVENPVCIMSTAWRKPDQIIQPYMFGDRARKTTCLWLKGLPKLVPTNQVDEGETTCGNFSVGASTAYARDEEGKIIPWNDPRTAIIRSKTFPGIAEAMAEQWGKVETE